MAPDRWPHPVPGAMQRGRVTPRAGPYRWGEPLAHLTDRMTEERSDYEGDTVREEDGSGGTLP